MAGPNKPFDPDDDALFGDAEIFFESPTAPSAPSPLAGEGEGQIFMIAEPLPEMSPEIWQAGIQALVSVSDDAPAPSISANEWMNEADMFAEESKLREAPAEAATLLYAAGRASLAAGDVESAVRLFDRALAQSPGAPEVLRARAQVAESQGDADGAQPFWELLAEESENPAERELYRTLSAEWTLARLGVMPANAKNGIPGTAARALAAVEVEMPGGRAGETAGALVDAGLSLTGPLGGALCEQAARIGDLAADRAAAKAARDQGRKLDPDAPRGNISLLLAAARSEDKQATGAFAELARTLPPDSRLAHAATRTAAGLASRSGDDRLAASLFAELPPTTIAAARDRIDFELRVGGNLDAASLDRLRDGEPGPAGIATLAWIEASSLLAGGDAAAALVRLGQALEQAPDAVALGLLAEDIAAASDDPAIRATALELWLRVDPGRRAEAALALAEARRTIAGEGDADAVRPALQAAIDAAPGSALFWRVAASDARAGRRADAAAMLSQAADRWNASTLAPGLRAAAAAALASVDPAAALAGLTSPAVARAFGADARARLAARVGDRHACLAALAEAENDAHDRGRKAVLAAQRATLVDDAGERARALNQALHAAPDAPLALALCLGDDEFSLPAAIAALARAATAAVEGSQRSGLAHLYRATASAGAELLEDGDEALHRASELVDAVPGDRQAHLALIRAARRLDPDRRARAIGELPANPEADPEIGLVVAEALMESGDRARAAVIFRELASGRFAPEGRRALSHLGLEGGRRMPARLLFGAADETAAVVRAELAETLDAARTQQWPAVVAALESGPPHEDVAAPAALHAAALLAEGRVEGGNPLPIERALVAAAGEDVAAVPLLALARLAQDPSTRIDALAAAAAAFAARDDNRSLAVVHTWIASARLATGQPDRAAESWQAALAADPSCLHAALALRREVAQRGDVAAAIDAAEVEASCLRVPAHRVRALLLAAALAEEMSAKAPQGTDAAGRGRALRLLRAALEVDPAHDAAFEQLRSLLEQEGDAAGLAAALAARIAVAQNPFEVTSLRLARAEALAGKLADRPGAEQELQAILTKQPEHPRALARLSELHWDGEEWDEAGEIYLQRAVVEREPRTLREIFLRLGHIYSERVPDPKRAITAFERVRALEPDNREALRALSELYVAEGDTKLALPITDRLVTIEPNASRRATFRVRLGELLMRSGDVARAGSELRAAVDARPRDIGAVAALAQLLERTRDASGRRALLDHTAGLLRHDIERGSVDLETLQSLAGVLPLRERPQAAAAAAQLVARLTGTSGATAPWSGRDLRGLRRPDVDERAFPPALPHGVRQIFRLLGPLLRPSGPELAQALARYGLGRSDRIGRGTPPRPVFDAVGAELHAGEFDLYVKAGGADPGVLRAEPGMPPSIIVGSRIAALGGPALRFAAARTLRLVATGLDLVLAASPAEAAALLVGIVRQFVPEYRHPDLRDALVDAEAARAARLIPRRLRSQVMPFAVESAGPFEPAALHGAVRDGANAVGLLAIGDLPTALTVVLAIGGGLPVDGALTLPAIVANPEALALLRFAVSDAYDELVSAISSA